MRGISRFLSVAVVGIFAVVAVACAGGSAASQNADLGGTESTSSSVAVTSTSTTVVPDAPISVESPTTTARPNPTTTVESGPSAAEIAAQKEAQYQATRVASFNECMAKMQANHDQYVRNTTASEAQAEAGGWTTPALREYWRAMADVEMREFQGYQQQCRTIWGF